ncbi:MAG: BMP family ABC transporter substrate-binding protein [Armatimonadetes bacterium]|nr:BMP family ABC transporter substrate-binding protein [Armatimonadota bacterium]
MSRWTIFTIPLLILLFFLFCVSGCSKPKQAPSEGKLKAAVVTDVGGIGDMSFNAMAWEGLQRAGKDFGIEIKFLESKEQADYAPNLRKFAEQGYDIIFAVGFLMEDALAQVAPKFPKTKFAIIDGNAPNTSNAVALKFREEEGCFLAGALAGMVTKTGKIGFVGGMEVPLIKRFECGYKAGAMATHPGIKVFTAYTGRWDDPARGKELALSQFGRGADIVFHASGSCGLGVIEAAKLKGQGFFAIGVDADQDYIAPGRVLTSMMKRVDNAVYSTCKSVVMHTFKPGDRILGLKEGGVGLSPMKYTKQVLPPGTMDMIEELKQAIIEGKIKPPKTEKELKEFESTLPLKVSSRRQGGA